MGMIGRGHPRRGQGGAIPEEAKETAPVTRFFVFNGIVNKSMV